MRKWPLLNKYRGIPTVGRASIRRPAPLSGGAANRRRCQMTGDLKTRDSELFARKIRRISAIGSLPQVMDVHRNSECVLESLFARRSSKQPYGSHRGGQNATHKEVCDVLDFSLDFFLGTNIAESNRYIALRYTSWFVTSTRMQPAARAPYGRDVAPRGVLRRWRGRAQAGVNCFPRAR